MTYTEITTALNAMGIDSANISVQDCIDAIRAYVATFRANPLAMKLSSLDVATLASVVSMYSAHVKLPERENWT